MAEAAQPLDTGSSSVEGTGKSLPSYRGVVWSTAAPYIPCGFCSDQEMSSKKDSGALFFPSNPQTQLAALRPRLLRWLSLSRPVPALLLILPGPVYVSWVPSVSPMPLLGSTRVISADAGKAGTHPEPGAMHPALPNQHRHLTSTFRHFINFLHLIPTKRIYTDSLPINQ